MAINVDSSSSESFASSSEPIGRPNPFVRRSKVIGGVCSGLAEGLGLDVVLVRITWIVLACFGVGLVGYVLCWIAFPNAADPDVGNHKRIFGVCLEVAKRAKQPVGLIRLMALALLFVSVGSVLVGYGLALLVLPKVDSEPSSRLR